ncbi:MAG TPA: helix-turn-helix domain-containing protein [Acidimicrobiales bacterium]|nr:helix-turn-helix domain-containing protein [Acidimicrobiales bacterium]
MALPRRQLLTREQRQATILRGAAAAFARTGFAATSMEDVATASGITKLIVYRHFASKEELYRAVLESVSSRLAEEFLVGLEGPGPRGGIGARTLLTVAREEPNGFVLLWRHAAREAPFADYAQEHRQRAVGAARLLLGDRLDDEVLSRWAADAIVDWLVEAVLGWLAVGDPERDEELLDLAHRTVVAMVTTWASR